VHLRLVGLGGMIGWRVAGCAGRRRLACALGRVAQTERSGVQRLYVIVFCGGIGSGYVIAVIRRTVMSRRIEGWERWLAPGYCFYLIFLVHLF